jgi:uncharacterized membrane protein (DUF485 family)
VCLLFKVSCDIYVLVCVSLDLFWYCMVMMCGFFADSFCAIFVYLRFGVLLDWSRYWFGTALQLSTVSYGLCLGVKVSQISICSNGKTHTTCGCMLQLCS